MRNIEKEIDGYLNKYIEYSMSLVDSKGKDKKEIEKIKDECLKIVKCINNIIKENGIQDSELAKETSDTMFFTLFIIETIRFIEQEVGDVDVKSAWDFCNESLKFKDGQEFEKRLKDYIEQLKSQREAKTQENPTDTQGERED